MDLSYKHTLAVTYWPVCARYVPETSSQYLKKSHHRYDSKKELPSTMKKLPVIQWSYVMRLIVWLYIVSGRWIKCEYSEVAKWEWWENTEVLGETSVLTANRREMECWSIYHAFSDTCSSFHTKSRALTLRRLMSYIYGAPILDVSRSHKTTQHSR